MHKEREMFSKEMIILLLTFFSVSFRSPVLAIELKEMDVRADVVFSPDTEIYTYEYRVTNPDMNTTNIDTLAVYRRKPDGAMDLSMKDLIVIFRSEPPIPPTDYLRDKTYEENLRETLEVNPRAATLPPTIPVGVRPPAWWTTGFNVDSTVEWSAMDPDRDGRYEIHPGETKGGYELTSYGLPGIRTARVQASVNIKQPLEEAFKEALKTTPIEEMTAEQMMAINQQALKMISVEVKTLGPTAPPANFVSLDFLAYLIDLKHQAADLGWIGGRKLVEELDKKLDQVKEKLAAGETEPARGMLGAFINKVEAHYKETKEQKIEPVKGGKEEKKFITSEGYALLKFNAKYLREQLDKPKEPEDKEEHEE
jgi:hypothetical protein